MKTRTVVLSIVCAGICVGSSLADEGAEGKGEKKGRGAQRHERFKAADTDGDGSLSLAEFKVVHAKRVAKIREKLGDRFDEERAAKRPSVEEIFGKIDADKSGGLTAQEMKKAHQRMRQRHQQRRQGGRDGKKREGGEDKQD